MAESTSDISGVEHEEMPMTAGLNSVSEDEKDEELSGLYCRQHKFKVHRPLYSQEDFDQESEPNFRHRKSLIDRWKEIRAKNACSPACVGSKFTKYFPFLRILKNYNLKRDLIKDIISGITVGIMHIPQGMAYGMLANLPPVYGLYVSFFPVIIYFFLGTSKHISKGTFAVVSLMIGTVVDKGMCGTEAATTNNTHVTEHAVTNGSLNTTLAPFTVPALSDEELVCRVGIATATTFIVGIIQFLMGVFKIGFVSVYLSDPLTRGFTTAAAVHVFTSQIKHVFGIRVKRFTGPLNLIYTYIDFFSKITTTNMASLIMAVLCMAIIYVVKEYANPRVRAKIKMPVPIELMIVIIATIISHFLKFEDMFGMIVVGEIPTGIPPPSLPPVQRFSSVVGDAVSISMVAFAVDLAMAKLLANKHDYPIEANQELRAYGVTNMVCACFNCFVSVASLSRSLVQEAVGGVTQIAGLVSCCLLGLVLFLLGPLFEQLPNNVLAAIVIVNLKGMFLQLVDLKTLWRVSASDFLIWSVIFFATIIINVDLGLFIGVGFSLLTVVFRTQSPYTSTMGRLPYTDIYKDISVYPKVKEIPRVKIFRFESALYFANCEHFVQKLYKKTVNPRKMPQLIHVEGSHVEGASNEAVMETVTQGEAVPAIIILDCSSINYVDYPGVIALKKVISEFNSVDIRVMLAACKAGVREMLTLAADGELAGTLYITLHDAVLAALLQLNGTAESVDTIDQSPREKDTDLKTNHKSSTQLPSLEDGMEVTTC